MKNKFFYPSYLPILITLFLAQLYGCVGTSGQGAQGNVEVMPKGHDGTAVRVITDKQNYRRDEVIFVTIRNDLSAVVYAPPSQTYCSVVRVQRQEAGQWITQGSTGSGGTASLITIAAKGKTRFVLGPATQESKTQGPMVGKPSVPGVYQGDLRDLPKVEPWKPGDPIREVPRGGPQAEGQRLPTSCLSGEIVPGTYRIEFRFKLRPTSERAQKVYSKEFVVID